MSDHILDGNIRDIAAAMRAGATSARALVDEASRRHDSFGAALGAYKLWDNARARREAGACDELLAGGYDAGALMGMPISLKDLYGVRGMPTFGGTPAELPEKWRDEGPVTEALRVAGGVIMGKTHTVEFAYGGVGTNAHWGAPVNPWDGGNHRVTGGSSSGAGVSLNQGSALVAMEEAKRSGGGFVACAPDQSKAPASQVILAGDIRDAIDQNELILHYQPKVAMKDGRVIGAEALVRWNHPHQGLIYPDSFIPLVERTGLINSLTLTVLDMALAQARIWQDSGNPMSISVNLSSRALHDARLPEHISERLRFHNVPPEGLILEITETAIMIDADKAMEVVTSLSELGVDIAIDDFGTGYSSLAYLRRLPAREIKIDRSFVLNMHKNVDDKTIVRSVIDLAHNLGMKVVAEGVESREIYDLLKSMDCYCAQGYYISRPVDDEEFSCWLDDPVWEGQALSAAQTPAMAPAERT